MAITSAQLAAAITAGQLTFNVQNVSGSGLPAVGALPLPYGNPVLIDSEIMYAVAQPVTNTITVRTRGSDGTSAVPHDILANLYTSNLTGDFPLPYAGSMITMDISQDNVQSIGTSETITPSPVGNTVYNINATAAAAIVLAVPSLASNGVFLAFTANTSAAHTITCTGLIQDGSGIVRSTATMNGTKGAAVRFVIENGFYNVDGAPQGVTFT